MAITRIGTFSSQSFVMTQINTSLSKYVTTQEQITTGQKTQRYSGISDQAALSIDLSNNKATLEEYGKSASTTNSRISAMHASISDILDMVTKYRAQLIQGLTADQADDAKLDAVADYYLKQVESALNTDLGGVYLFGGIKTDAPPVDLSDPIDNQNGEYYSGAEQLLSARVDDNTVLEYGATADRQGFKDLIASLQRVASASSSQTQLETALDEVNAALNDLTQLEAETGHKMSVVEQSIARNQAYADTITLQLGSIQDIDISVAMVELTQRQTILQASYSVISRTSQLSLTNYL